MGKPYLCYALGLYVAFAVDHAIDVFALGHHDPGVDPAAFYRTLLMIGVSISLVSALVFLLGLRTLPVSGSRPRLSLPAASALSGVLVSLGMFSVAHLTEKLWGAESTLAHAVALGALLLLSAGAGGLAAALGGVARPKGYSGA